MKRWMAPALAFVAFASIWPASATEPALEKPLAFSAPDLHWTNDGTHTDTHHAGSSNYPDSALRQHLQGTVVLLIDWKDGHVRDVRIERSCGYAQLDRAARNSSLQWIDTAAVDGLQRIFVAFQLPISVPRT